VILVIDNFDSFVHNLARYVRELGADALVCRRDEITLPEIETLAPSHIILSPGPCSPAEAGISVAVVERFGPTTPILGVCLGHQCIGAAFGADIVRASRAVHGRTSLVTHDGTCVFSGLPSPLVVARYHSLVIARRHLPSVLRVVASSDDDGEIMAVEHLHFPVVGVQFHPESAASEYGYAMLDSFLRISRTRDAGARATLSKWADGVDPTASAPAPRESHPPWTSLPADDVPFVPPPVSLVR
jgi:anthranilate synthase component 2